MTGRSSHPSRDSPSRSESPGPEEVEAELTRSLLLDLRRVASARHVARARLDAALSRVDRIEPILELEPEVVLEVVRVHETETGAQSKEPVAADLLADDGARVQQAVKIRVILPRCLRIVHSSRLDLHDVHEIARDGARQQRASIS